MTETNIEKLGYNEPHQYDIEELIELQNQQLQRQKKASVVDKFTGEVKRYRSMANPGNYDDGTIIVAPSETDTSEYEPIETTIERCSRTGYLRDYMAKMKAYDKENVVDNNSDNFDFEPDIIETPGFDLADAKEKETEIIEQIKRNSNAATSEPASADVSSNEEESAVTES